MRRLRIEHATRYRYRNAVLPGPHKLLLRPREGHDLRIESSRLDISPPCRLKWYRDVYGNSVGAATFADTATELAIVSEVVIEHYEEAPLDFIVDPHAVMFPFPYGPEDRADLIPYLLPNSSSDSTALSEWVARFWSPGRIIETYVLLDAMNRAICAEFEYVVREEPGVQSPAETLRGRSGSCRDFAALFIDACRCLGLAARFVSGYRHAPLLDGVHAATHAWSEVYLPGAGWKGFDSTGGEVVGHHHIATAVSRHPEAVPPVSGSYGGDPGGPPQISVDVVVSDVGG